MGLDLRLQEESPVVQKPENGCISATFRRTATIQSKEESGKNITAYIGQALQ